MIELAVLISYISDGHYQRQYCEGVRDSLIDKARHTANKQRQRIIDAEYLRRTA